jgi:hypothetical protein
MSVFLFFIAFFFFFSDEKTFCKKSCRKAYTTIDKKSKTFFFLSNFCLSRFCALLDKGIKKHPKGIGKKQTLVLFLASGPPTHHRGHRFSFFLAVPWTQEWTGHANTKTRGG